jgi:hypothetical protein
MRNTLVVCAIVLIGFAAFAAEEECNVPFFNTKIFKIEEKSTDSNVVFEFGKEKLEVVGKCEDSRRGVTVQSSGRFEIIAEHFSSGAVRQYVIKLCGKELGIVKVERTASKLDAYYAQPRLSLTDPFGRILGEVANADNEADHFVIRDSAGHILAHGKKILDSWTVDSGTMHPLLVSAVLFASRMERNACELVAANWERTQGYLLGAFVGLVTFCVARYNHLV